MPMLETNGRRFDYAQEGQGRPLVLLHSLLTERESFAPIVPALARIRRATLLSLPGFGESSPEAGSIEDRADRVAEFLEALAPGAAVDVLGNGFGGFIAIALAARHPRRVGRLILADTGATFTEEGRAPFRGMAAAVRKSGMEAILEPAVRRIFPADYLAAHPQAAEERKAVLRQVDPIQFAAACEALAAVDLRPALGQIESATLVVVGALDEATPPALARALAAGIRGAKLFEIPGCGHCPPLQQPAVFLRAIEPFLES